MEENSPKKYKLKIDMSYWYYPIEEAHIKVTSPTGKTLTIYKKLGRDYFTSEETELVKAMIVGTDSFTVEEMKLLKKMSEATEDNRPKIDWKENVS